MSALRAAARHLPMALVTAVGVAVAQTSSHCIDWQYKFTQVNAAWLEKATSRAELERIFGLPSRSEPAGACVTMHYAAAGCSAAFTVCSADTVVSKSFTAGAATVPALITNEPEKLKESIASLDESLKSTQARLRSMQETVDTLAPPPSATHSVEPPPPPRPRAARPAAQPVQTRKCAAITKEGKQCSRNAVKGVSYCWQHRK